ncbi:MAG: helix-turn-helix transcriptional regulator, partial [Mesorhizobium sp.]
VATLNREQHPSVRHGRLSRRALGRVRAYIDAHMNADISLSELAAVADMAVDSFARRFKATTGLAPYAYVI